MYTIENIAEGPESTAADRSRMYQMLSNAFMYPDEDFFAPVTGGDFKQALEELLVRLP